MSTAADPLAVLTRIRRSAATAAPGPQIGEVCEMCATPIGDEHGHVVDVETRRLMCACRGCYLLFARTGAGGGHFRAVPTRCVAFDELTFGPAEWSAMQIPVSIAFFFVNSSLDRVCGFYPGPAGATESLLPLETWAQLVATNPVLAEIEPDVEAFLVRADPRGSTPPECFLVPIDWCYELVGELRRSWRGFDGGQEAHDALDSFFDRVKEAGGTMTAGLAFEVVDGRAEPHAAAPTIALRLRVTAADDEPVHAVALNCQVRIEPQRRTYDPAEEEALRDLFGDTSQWGRSLRPFLWTNVPAMIPAFTGTTEVDLLVPCTYDMEVAGARYLHGLQGGEVPLLLLFSGTAFGAPGAGGGGGFTARPLSWSDETSFRLPRAVWREAIDAHFPDSTWLRLSHENFDGLARFKADRALATWDQVIERILKEVGEP